MISVNEAFTKFRSRLEATQGEETNASRRQQRIRAHLDASDLAISRDFLSGSYRRETKTKPLRDVDIFVVLEDRTYLSKHPRRVLDVVHGVLEPHYPGRTHTDRLAVRIDFGAQVVDDTTDEVMSFDVVPAFDDRGAYLIPDDFTGKWIRTDPTVHASKATQANKDYGGNWKPLVKMLKKWNEQAGSPVQPSFLIEVMALGILSGTWGGTYSRELRGFFAEAARRIDEVWPDPAGVGPDVSDELDADPTNMATARAALLSAEKSCTRALMLDQQGKTGDALAAWRRLLGPLFAKS
ncbi:CBASS oligonucleotide cyclase [Geodermatophilus sp. DSM 44513]|uniref:CBASS oligonucleotide cyclase n=1 Tax=Geodermatophilus sp. DSM 44513 TaxID=1528104 RepID=UPI00127BC828|nr:CBASS oligonucleotide cyclase [Geodermatophilus sp. DSM 44513]WNV74349.1 CBASS oligonucleotide cyclase [Geodermatophilus sp. DSM 44513]